MLKEKFISFIEGKSAYGLDVKISSSGELELYFVELNLKKEEVTILQKSKGLGIDDLFSKSLNSKQAVYLNLRGRGVLSKLVDHKEEDTAASLLQKALPNVKADELYFYTSSISSTQSWIQFVRKSILEEILEKIRQNGFHVVGVTLGETGINNIIELLDDQSITFEGKSLEKIEGKFGGWSSSEVNDLNIKLGDDFIPNCWLIAYAVAFQHFLGGEAEAVQSEALRAEREEYRQRNMFSLGVKFVLAFFLCSLLVNFFLFQDYSSQYSELSERLQLNQSQLNRLSQLRKEKENKEKFFLKTDLISASNSTFYADRLASSKTEGITWNELNINPSKRKIEKGEDVEFDIKTINIDGIAKSSAVLNDWIVLLKQEDWIKTINIKGFQKIEKKQVSKFKLQIEVK